MYEAESDAIILFFNIMMWWIKLQYLLLVQNHFSWLHRKLINHDSFFFAGPKSWFLLSSYHHILHILPNANITILARLLWPPRSTTDLPFLIKLESIHIKLQKKDLLPDCHKKAWTEPPGEWSNYNYLHTSFTSKVESIHINLQCKSFMDNYHNRCYQDPLKYCAPCQTFFFYRWLP